RPSACDPDTRSRPKPHSICSKPAEGPGHGPSCTRNLGGFVACLEASRKRSTQFLSRSEWIRLSIGSQPRKKNWSTCRQGSSSETKRCSSAALAHNYRKTAPTQPSTLTSVPRSERWHTSH